LYRPDQQLMVTAVSAAGKQQDSSIWSHNYWK